MRYTLDNIYEESKKDNPVKYSKVIGGAKWRTHQMENSFEIKLSTGKRLKIEKGWRWDRSSVPQLLWGLFRPDGDDDIAYVIHDRLYELKKEIREGTWLIPESAKEGCTYDTPVRLTRKFADKEMLKWAKAMKQTRKWSLRNIDIHIRYYAVRALGGIVW
jgi:hypothetical protein